MFLMQKKKKKKKKEKGGRKRKEKKRKELQAKGNWAKLVTERVFFKKMCQLEVNRLVKKLNIV